MTINYKVVGKVNPRNPQEPLKYYASINSKGKRNVRFIAKEIADRSSLNEMDVLSVIEGFLQIIPKTLNDGYSVDLGEFGSYRTTAKSQASDTKEHFNTSHIIDAKVHFRPGTVFKETMKSVKFVKINESEKEEEAEEANV